MTKVETPLNKSPDETDIILDIETTGLDPLNDTITYVGMFNIATRETIIKEFKLMTQRDFEWLNPSNRILFWGRGEFDVPMLKFHAAKKGIYFDAWNTQNLFQSMKQGCELLKDKHSKDFAEFFGIVIMRPDLHGKDMPQFYKEGKHDLIIKHLESDLKMILHLYYHAKEMFLA